MKIPAWLHDAAFGVGGFIAGKLFGVVGLSWVSWLIVAALVVYLGIRYYQSREAAGKA